MKARITSSVTLFLALGLSSSVFAATASSVGEDELMLAASDTVETVDAVEGDVLPEDVLPEEVNMEELMAEIRVACEEAAEDEQIPEENRAAFTEECVAENMAVDSPDDSMSTDDGAVSDDAMPIEEDVMNEEEIIPDDVEVVDDAPEEAQQD